ncbi:MAG TPA: efflux RND transporter periplasmic adaptor subunit [Alphaproteobacteria bacterium]|nr:efflux RND transporter periplasmic adaptor subunit [Alphaproteobacteria bacterium]
MRVGKLVGLGLLGGALFAGGYALRDGTDPRALVQMLTAQAAKLTGAAAPAPSGRPGQAQGQAPGGGRGPGGQRPPAPVEVAPVKRMAVTEELSAVGTLLANESVTLQPEISGRIARILFEEGTRVEAGAPLVRLDDTMLRAELLQAQARLNLSEANFSRADALARSGSGTARTRDEAVTGRETARADVALAQARLEKTVINAPFAGIVGLRTVSVGDYVTPQDTLVNLESIDPLKVDFRAPEIYLSRLRRDQPIAVTVDAYPGQVFTGQIYAIDPLVDAEGRAVRLRARIPNPAEALRPGLFARVTVTTESRENALVIPEAAVFAQGQDKFVYRVAEGKAALVKVVLGQRRAGDVEVVEGLAEGESVVLAGHARLRDGAAVDVVAPAGGA